MLLSFMPFQSILRSRVMGAPSAQPSSVRWQRTATRLLPP